MEGRKMKKLLKKMIVKLLSIIAERDEQRIGHLDYTTGKITW
jgi:hypothetical protein